MCHSNAGDIFPLYQTGIPFFPLNGLLLSANTTSSTAGAMATAADNPVRSATAVEFNAVSSAVLATTGGGLVITGDGPMSSATAVKFNTVSSSALVVTSGGTVMPLDEELGMLIFRRTGSRLLKMLAKGVLRPTPTGLLIV